MSAVRASPEERAAAIDLYREHGLAETARLTGVAKSTLRGWAREEGLDPGELAGADAARVDAANLARAGRISELRLDLREQLLETAADMLERTRQPHIDFRGKEGQRVEFDQAPADACRNYTVAAAVCIDKFRLESGESTSKTEIERGPLDQQVGRIARMRDELGERRRSQIPAGDQSDTG